MLFALGVRQNGALLKSIVRSLDTRALIINENLRFGLLGVVNRFWCLNDWSLFLHYAFVLRKHCWYVLEQEIRRRVTLSYIHTYIHKLTPFSQGGRQKLHNYFLRLYILNGCPGGHLLRIYRRVVVYRPLPWWTMRGICKPLMTKPHFVPSNLAGDWGHICILHNHPNSTTCDIGSAT